MPAGDQQRCRIEQALGRDELCPEGTCAFWEKGAATRGWCAFGSIDFSNDADLAQWLADVRRMLEAELRDARSAT